MLIANELKRVFIHTENHTPIRLPDPNPRLDPQQVLNWYANTYPILTTARVSGGEIEADKVVYRFETTLGTKG
jgi:PRTRC genetic system protein C